MHHAKSVLYLGVVGHDGHGFVRHPNQRFDWASLELLCEYAVAIVFSKFNNSLDSNN